jgi:hypothetical protein
LSTDAGFQLPVIPFNEVAGNAGTVPPEQTLKDVPKLNEGVMLAFMVTVNEAVVAHWPADGVKL